MNLSHSVLGVTFDNPTVLASGIMGITAASWRLVAENGAGGITTKSLWPQEHQGNRNPVIISTEHWTLNAVGVPDAGPEKAREEIGDYLKEHPTPLIANIIGLSADEFAAIAGMIAPLKPDFIEVNLSTPTFLKLRGKLFAEDESESAAILKAVKKEIGGIPLFAKLTPNVPAIGEIAKACVDAGADGITAINTVGPGMAIDLRSRMPILSTHKGGLSGPALKTIAVRCVAEIYESTAGKVPIIGTGGVYTGEDAIEMMLAGATLVGIGTAVGERGIDVFKKVCDEMQLWCTNEGVWDVKDLIGGMHKELLARGMKGTAMSHAPSRS
ncbi:MAG: Dihydroorotate dehydrogenase [Candidatus Peregrinibacteria bacterium Greene0416_19]|nr:MAG: Dihydroorotate dehydrogenase [Candidatus Peregrinibacteria bacterium Greene0416_19]